MEREELPPLPKLPPWPRLRIFFLGALWAGVCATAPALVVIYDWTQRWNDPIDWTMITHLAGSCAIAGIVGYWRKYKALLQEPPAPLPPLDVRPEPPSDDLTEDTPR